MATMSIRLNVNNYDYETDPSVVIPFVPKVIRACNMDGVDLAFVSFDGTTDAAVLLNDVKSPSSVMEWRWQMGLKVWLRADSSPVLVQIIAEA